MICLGTQSPKDLDPSILKFLHGPKFIGQMSGIDSELDAILEKIIGHSKKKGARSEEGFINAQILDRIRGLRDKQFLYAIATCQRTSNASDVGEATVTFCENCRLSKDSGRWNGMARNPAHPMRSEVHAKFQRWLVETGNNAAAPPGP